ncbi:MAG: hypothetical protein M0R80_23115 [Proteobacteria bacterium]|jgi:hypothetical protein|nr:hypothetical protein [Pseudomonadota bacterium]
MPSAAHRRRALGCACLVLAAWLAPAPSVADPARRIVVVISQADADPMTERALDAIGAGLVDVPVTLVPRRIAGWDDAISNRVDHARDAAASTGAIAVIWLDLSAPQHVFLFIADSTGGRVLVRNVQTEAQDVEAQLETLAVIVRGSIEGLLAGGRIGVERPVSNAAPADTPERLGASIGYALQLFAPTDPIVHGARIELRVRAAPVLYVLAAYRLDLPVEVESPEIAADIWSHPIELGLFGEWRFSRWRLDVGACAVVDIVTFRVTSRDWTVDAREPGAEVTAAIYPFVRVDRIVGRLASVFFSIGIDIELYNHRYVVTTSDESRVVVAPWRVRPIFELGAKVTLL